MDHEAYMKFVLENHEGLNLPYPFAVKLSFAGSPLVLGKAMLVISEEAYELVGAAGFVFGTGTHDHEDRDVCQAEVAFLLPEYRGTTLFIRGLLALIDLAAEENPDVEWFQFWAPNDRPELTKLFSKFAALPGACLQTVNEVTLYRIPFAQLAAYARSLSSIREVEANCK
ncbi:hypothetical protein [Cohnella cholangitidis]|uniref:N-acetyltransferase domain-containing protein n=1 Tax=Cohnella cholangitidis TaxID=2598458 RepID=A0A7G5BS37_9BACL|nr:hypothetical protein [Cohnella cholangitidis]QMV39771.1 hypothetical protein FPL14_00030 [Cohnella cholangitidis]